MIVSQIEAGDISWRIREFGAPKNPTVLFLHGFTWTSEAWHAISEALSSRFHCLAVDLPGHGGTRWPDASSWTFDDVVGSLLELTNSLVPGSFKLVGYSLGGRLALRLATMAPERIEQLVLIGASAGLESEVERIERRMADDALASDLEHDGLQAFVERWTNLPLFAGMKRLPPETQASYRATRLAQDARGLATSLRVLGVGSQPCLIDRLDKLEMRTLLVVGEEDDKFQGIARSLQQRLPHASLETVANSGHAVPFERPEALIHSLTAFMTSERAALT